MTPQSAQAGRLGYLELVLNLHSSLVPPAPPVPLHPFTAADVVQRGNPHQETGACAVHRVSVNGPLQAHRIHTEESEDQMCSKSLKGRKFRRASGKDNCQRHGYDWIFPCWQYLFLSSCTGFFCFVLVVTRFVWVWWFNRWASQQQQQTFCQWNLFIFTSSHEPTPQPCLRLRVNVTSRSAYTVKVICGVHGLLLCKKNQRSV